MAVRGRLLSIAVLGGLLLPALPRAEAGDKYLVMLDIEGERKPSSLKKSITRIVKSQHKIMDGANWKDAARRLRAGKLIPVNVKKVCSYLEVDGVIDGTLVKDDDQYKFVLRVRSCATGAISKKIPMLLNAPRLSDPGMIAGLEERLLGAIDNLGAGGGKRTRVAEADVEDDDEDAEDEDEEEDDSRASKAKKAKEAKAERLRAEKAEKAEKAELARAEKLRAAKAKADKLKADKAKAAKAKRTAKRDDDEDEEDDADEEDDSAGDDEESEAEEEEDEDDEDRPKKKRAAMKDGGDEQEEDDEDTSDASTSIEASSADRPSGPTSPRHTPVLLYGGASFTGRKLAFKHTGDAADAPPGYRGKPVPGFFLTGAIFPLAFGGKRGGLANIGVGFVADRAVGIKSAVDDGMGGSAQLATREYRYGGSLIYRYNMGDDPDGLSIQASVGYNKLGFSIDKNAAPMNVVVDVPNVVYTYVDPGVGARIPIAGKLSGLLDAKFLAVLDTGEIQKPEEYGAATVTGFDVDGGLEYRIGQHLLVRGGARLLLMGYKFKGTGAQTDRNGDDATDVGGASDRYLGGYLTGGYVF